MTPDPSRTDALATALYWLVATPVILASYMAEFGWQRASAGMAYTVLLDTAAAGCLVFGVLPGLLTAKRRPWALAGLLLFLTGSAVLYHGGCSWLLGTRDRAANERTFAQIAPSLRKELQMGPATLDSLQLLLVRGYVKYY